jgi:phosphoribosylformylglycinamidine cyclo-ligase
VREIFKGPALKRWGPKLITPTRIYVDEVSRLMSALRHEGHIVLGMAHITGGGLVENVPRILPKGSRAVFYRSTWRRPAIIEELQKRGKVPDADMWKTFNMGLGMVFVVRPDSVPAARRAVPELMEVGEIVRGKNEVEIR